VAEGIFQPDLSVRASLMDVGCFCAGLHCESGVWSMLFGLLMWDCLFTDVPDTLRTQFQLAPLDLNTPHFYEVAVFASEDPLVHSKAGTPHAMPVLKCMVSLDNQAY